MPTYYKKILAKVLLKSLMDWDVDSNLLTITLDNCSTNNVLIFDLKIKYKLIH